MNRSLTLLFLLTFMPGSAFAALNAETLSSGGGILANLIDKGQTPAAAVDSMMIANPGLSLADTLSLALAAGVDLNTVMSIALAKAPNATAAVAAVTEAALANGMTLEQVVAAAQAAGVPGDVIAAGVAAAQDATAAGGDTTAGTTVEPLVVPAPPANAGQPIS
ncbi:MAG: hypothetical protein CMI00_06735 [Oceanospirillaceae bacterium]|nr:hypothetical protein [Oceanospirillaceae bacterium]|tara:strand:- start:16673 stop:17164 length:492 start_codon:yes stop_codon:yes gene_type:complete